MANIYPDQTIILPNTTIRRERLLPPDLTGDVVVREGEHVGAFDVVVRGVRSSHYVILDMMAGLKISDVNALGPLLHVGLREPVKQGQVIAGDQDRKRPFVRTPVTGIVSEVVDGRMVIQAGLAEVVVRAGFTGQVVSIRAGRGILLETAGALAQGMWGNGQAHFGTLRLELSEGLDALQVDEFATEWRGAIVVARREISRVAMEKAVAQGIGGIVAPGMKADLRDFALGLKIPIMLTEGFGIGKMGDRVSGILQPHVGRQAALNAYVPDRWKADRPELIVPQHNDRIPPAPVREEPLRVGAEVRLTRSPYTGMTARVLDLPKAPRVLENGLRLMVAQVTLQNGSAVTVPLANLELFGRG